MPVYELNKDKEWIVKIIKNSKLCKSNNQAKRMIKQNAVSIDGDKIHTIDFDVDKDCVIKVGKRRFVRVVKK